MTEPSSTRKPRTKRERRGHLTSRLVSEEAMNRALRYLLEDAQRYMLIVNRSTVNTESGEIQDASITLSEDNPPSLDNGLDPRIKYSRQVIIVLVQKDGGVAKVNLTSRTWEVWVKSPTLPRRIRVFNKELTSGAYSRFFTSTTALGLFTIPVWLPFLLFIIWTFCNNNARHAMWSNSKAAPNIPLPVWDQHIQSLTFKLWPLFIVVALGIAVVVLTSGGLRIWPRYLSNHSFQRTVYEIKSNFSIPQNLNSPLFVAVVSVILTAVLTYLITH